MAIVDLMTCQKVLRAGGIQKSAVLTSVFRGSDFCVI